MPLTRSEFIAILTVEVPEADPTVREHLDDNGGQLLLELLTADLQRLALRWFEHDSKDQFERLIGVIERGLREGDEQVNFERSVLERPCSIRPKARVAKHGTVAPVFDVTISGRCR